MASIDDVVPINFAKKICAFDFVLGYRPIDGLDQILAVSVSLPPMLVSAWAFDVREDHNKSMGCHVFEIVPIHFPLTGRAVHVA